jgi:hypothetical protein
MFIPDPDFFPTRIPNPKTAIKDRKEKKCCPTFFCSPKYHKIENYFIFELAKKKNWGNLQRIIELTPDPDPGSKRHRITALIFSKSSDLDGRSGLADSHSIQAHYNIS